METAQKDKENKTKQKIFTQTTSKWELIETDLSKLHLARGFEK